MNTDKWHQTTRAMPCPACGRWGWCSLSRDGTLALCRRVESPRAVRQRDGSTAWLHSVKDKAVHRMAAAMTQAAAAKPRPPRQWESLVKAMKQELTDRRLQAASRELGVSERSLLRLDAGWYRDYGMIGFPMRDARRRIVGVRLRRSDEQLAAARRTRDSAGRYLCVPGSANGLFIPADYEPAEIPPALADDEHPLVLVLPEGPTSLAAALDLGFAGIGRPSNTGGGVMVHALLLNLKVKQDVVIIADRDGPHYTPAGLPFWPGWEGAIALAEQLLDACGRLRVIQVPRGKDLREWLRSGGAQQALIDAIVAAPSVTATWLGERRVEVTQWRQRLSKPSAA